ncbi:MAG: HD domain-containing protein [Clostridia bacterium]|nr:HD domain-containing protein [Clostridia bacterium]
MTDKELFLDICKNEIKREGIDKFLEYLSSPASDFFTAPASTRFHASYEGGLLRHSLNVYENLKSYLETERAKNNLKLEYSDETIALVSLFHDVCKINTYKVSSRNVKDERGVWHSVPYYEFDDKLPYGHGEKSVYILSGYMKLTREEAFAIRYHVGFAGSEDSRNISNVFNMFPLALALYIADLEATYFLEK